jgi:MerR family mercuric resistance operon transcriptional regulator
MTIGELAEAGEVSVETVRYYERRGLVPEPPRTDSGYRDYPPDALARLRFIRRAKEFGFSLSEISELLALRVELGLRCARVKERAERTLERIEAQIDGLTEMRAALRSVVRACEQNRPTGECPVIETLEGDVGE